MEPSSTPSKPAPAAAAADHAKFQNESSPATSSSQPAKTDIQPVLPRSVVVAAVVVAAALPAIMLGVIVTMMVAANYNFLDWME